MSVSALRRQSGPTYFPWILGLIGLFAVVAIVAQLSMPLAGVLYAIGFWTVALYRRDLALMLVFAAAPFQNDLSTGGPVKFSLGELNLILTVPVMLLHVFSGKAHLRLGPIIIPSICYLGLCVFSSLLEWRGSDSLTSIIQMILYLVVAVTVYGSLPNDPAQIIPSLYGLIVVACFLSICTLVSFSGYVLGMHKNGIGASLSCAALIATELWLQSPNRPRKRILLAALLLISGGLLVTLSRGAWLATITGVFLLCALRGRIALALRIVLATLPVLLILWFVMPEESREYALNFDRSGASIDARYKNRDIAFGYFHKNPLFGVGVGLRKEMDATSIFWVTLAETGILGIIAFISIYVTLGIVIWKSRKLFLQSDPRFSLVALCAALSFGKLAHGMVDHFWSRGPILMAWASVGFVTLARSSLAIATDRSHGKRHLRLSK